MDAITLVFDGRLSDEENRIVELLLAHPRLYQAIREQHEAAEREVCVADIEDLCNCRTWVSIGDVIAAIRARDGAIPE